MKKRVLYNLLIRPGDAGFRCPDSSPMKGNEKHPQADAK